MRRKTSELEGCALDWAVALAENYGEGWLYRQMENPNPDTRCIPRFSTHWAEGGEIIERENITIGTNPNVTTWIAYINQGVGRHRDEHSVYGPTPLVAAMRCFVASRLGGEVEIPEELE